jgi:type II secretory pathway predicted ATPase ExeA
MEPLEMLKLLLDENLYPSTLNLLRCYGFDAKDIKEMNLQRKLPHLDRSQVGEYVKRHLAYAGADNDIFSDGAVDGIYRFSSGAASI